MAPNSSPSPFDASPIDLSVPIRFDGSQTALFDLPSASRQWARTDGFCGQVAGGASCNVETLTITPHVHGTHTECVGHITQRRMSLMDTWRPGPIRAILVSVTLPEGRGSEAHRFGVSARELESSVERITPGTGHADTLVPRAIILRTQTRIDGDSQGEAAARGRHLSVEAATWIRTAGFEHLLIDAPSVDPMDDGGRLAAHRAFWGMAPGSVEPDPVTPGPDPRTMTITELIAIPGNVQDGHGWLDIQIPPFDSDAAPSRPLFYPDVSQRSRHTNP